LSVYGSWPPSKIRPAATTPGVACTSSHTACCVGILCRATENQFEGHHPAVIPWVGASSMWHHLKDLRVVPETMFLGQNTALVRSGIHVCEKWCLQRMACFKEWHVLRNMWWRGEYSFLIARSNMEPGKILNLAVRSPNHAHQLLRSSCAGLWWSIYSGLVSPRTLRTQKPGEMMKSDPSRNSKATVL
jgi:hypothetical protein